MTLLAFIGGAFFGAALVFAGALMRGHLVPTDSEAGDVPVADDDDSRLPESIRVRKQLGVL